MVLRWSRRELWLGVRAIERALMAERNAGFGGTTSGGNGSSAGEPLCSLVAILCTSSEHLVEGAFDKEKESDKLNDEQNSHEGLLCAVRFCPMLAQVLPEGLGRGG